MSVETKPEAQFQGSDNRRDRAVVHSALWAAAGDALGWITELSHGPAGVVRRTGVPTVTKPVEWQRVIGGRTGPKVDLPAGTYSDDTQMRLAVSRSIRGDGSFDVETFAKIEVTVWPTYALGGGLGTKAAAVNLSRRSVNWFSNFFESGRQKYVNGGGNGAAMRIQPHVWSTPKGGDSLILNVLRDALVTHGHPHGFCGAVFHALCLADTIQHAEVPKPANWASYIDRFMDLPRLIAEEPQLTTFWQSAWENSAGMPVTTAIEKMSDEARRDLDIVTRVLETSGVDGYHEVVDQLGCLTPKFRGSGFKTALAALALAHLFRDHEIEECLASAANELESDTDTIATMAGALLGAVSPGAPEWPIQDQDYIVQEARRLSAIARGQPQDSFTYPDLGHWNPPAKQNASIGWFDGQLAIAGLGQLTPRGREYRSGGAIWQWFSLPFGQTIFAKRKSDLKEKIASTQLPGLRRAARTANHIASNAKHDGLQQPSLPLRDGGPEKPPHRNTSTSHPAQSLAHTWRDTIDAWSDEAISSNFDDSTLGRLLNRCIDQSQSVEATIGFAAIIAKAKLARQRRRRK